ncbi:hypothetical protein TWF481_004854 [Arthrobotrys musiformis]|uniref:Uncharacterized protein n=1 Tax=Arthrobotrys musiformis TaxID=47236 RepID=A0AAV9WL60_9PEZI
MASSGMTVLVEMPNLSTSVRIFDKVDDVNSLLDVIGSTCPFFEVSRMTVLRNSKALQPTDKLSFGEHLVVKYKYDKLDRAEAKAELEKVLSKMKDINACLRLLSTQNEDLVDKEQQNPNKGVVGHIQATLGKDDSGKSDALYYKEGDRVPVIRVKLPGQAKETIFVPGPDKESQARFKRIADADAERIRLETYEGSLPVAPLEHKTKQELEKERVEKENLEKEKLEKEKLEKAKAEKAKLKKAKRQERYEKAKLEKQKLKQNAQKNEGVRESSAGDSEETGTTDSFIPDEEIPQLKL